MLNITIRDRAQSVTEEQLRAGLQPSRYVGRAPQQTEEFLAEGYPILVGTSRKSYIGKIAGLEKSDRLIPTVTAGIIAVLGGASVLRVHDVRETKESILYLEALKTHGTV